MAKFDQIRRSEQRVGRYARRQKHGYQRGQDPARTSFIEMRNRDPATLAIAREDSGNQIARNDEENVHAQETLRQGFRPSMKNNDRCHGDRAKAIDVSTTWVAAH